MVNSKFDGIEFDPIETTIMAIDVPFYDGFRLLDIADYTVMPAIKRFVVYSYEKSAVLDFTNEPIYALNKEVPIELTKENIEEYIRFFFSFVRGRHGRFIITENIDDIDWKEEPPPQARKAIGKMIKPIKIKKTEADGYIFEVNMVFKDSLFKSDVEVKMDGTVNISNEELLIEDMPIIDDIFGQ